KPRLGICQAYSGQPQGCRARKTRPWPTGRPNRPSARTIHEGLARACLTNRTMGNQVTRCTLSKLTRRCTIDRGCERFAQTFCPDFASVTMCGAHAGIVVKMTRKACVFEAN